MKTTCQICARDIKANTGTIALHGYTRPGYGWQTESCMGAKFLPYEESRDRIPAILDAYKSIYKSWETQLREFKANPPETITKEYISPWTKKRDEKYDTVYERPESFSSKESLKIDNQPRGTYEREYNWQVYEMNRNIRDIKETRDWLQKRYDTWGVVAA